jgi:hypothetical protein
MSVRRWHWGKVVMLWAWGGIVVGLLITTFLQSPVEQSPTTSAVSFLASVAILLALSAVTWRWLGGKET